jgi:hypothetical protein
MGSQLADINPNTCRYLANLSYDLGGRDSQSQKYGPRFSVVVEERGGTEWCGRIEVSSRSFSVVGVLHAYQRRFLLHSTKSSIVALGTALDNLGASHTRLETHSLFHGPLTPYVRLQPLGSR